MPARNAVTVIVPAMRAGKRDDPVTQLEQDVIDSLTQAIVKCMTTGLWDDLRPKIVKIFSDGRRRRGKAVDDSLCAARARIISAQGRDELARHSEAAAEVAGMIRLLVAEDPACSVRLPRCSRESRRSLDRPWYRGP
jgi:hypothetical protein